VESSNGESLESRLHAPLSRRQMLTAVGGGLAGALTAGALSWNLTATDAASLPYVVLIVLDGAMPEYFKIPGIPHVQSLMRNGTQYTNAFAGILESETPSAHVTIGTGSEPVRTGIPSFWWANSDNVTVSLFSPTKIRAGDMEDIIRKAGVPTLAGRVHAKSRAAKVVALSGSKYYAADALGGPDADVTMYFQGNTRNQWVPTSIPGHAAPSSVLNAPGLVVPRAMPLGVQNHQAMKLAVEAFKRMRQQVTLINLPEFDWPLGHVDGGSRYAAGVKTLMQGFDRDLAMLQDAYRKAGVLGNTVFVFLADHGMMPLTHKVDSTVLSSAITRAGTSIVTQAYESAAYFWLKDESRAPQAGLNVAALKNPYIQSVYVRTKGAKGYAYHRVTSASLLKSGGTEAANQQLLGTFNGANAPDVVVLFAEGVGTEPGGQAGWKADHGGASWQAQRIPLILSGPNIRAGHVSSHPARLIDVAPTVLHAMGASYAGMQGIPLADAFKTAPAYTSQWQSARARQLMPVVAALQRQSQLEVAGRL
jgi:type I phosphodiesterase/nucleotide pyrophosphatase